MQKLRVLLFCFCSIPFVQDGSLQDRVPLQYSRFPPPSFLNGEKGCKYMRRDCARNWSWTKKSQPKLKLGLQNSLFKIFCCIIFGGRIFKGLGDWGPSTCLQPSAAETFPATRLLPTTRHQHAAGWSVAAAHIAAENVNVFDSPGVFRWQVQTN